MMMSDKPEMSMLGQQIMLAGTLGMILTQLGSVIIPVLISAFNTLAMATNSVLWPVVIILGTIAALIYGVYKAYQYFAGESSSVSAVGKNPYAQDGMGASSNIFGGPSYPQAGMPSSFEAATPSNFNMDSITTAPLSGGTNLASKAPVQDNRTTSYITIEKATIVPKEAGPREFVSALKRVKGQPLGVDGSFAIG